MARGARSPLGPRSGARGVSKGFGAGGVGGRGTGPRDGANFATCVLFLTLLTRTKRRKIAFFEGFPVGWGRVQGGAEKGTYPPGTKALGPPSSKNIFLLFVRVRNVNTTQVAKFAPSLGPVPLPPTPPAPKPLETPPSPRPGA